MESSQQKLKELNRNIRNLSKYGHGVYYLFFLRGI